MPTREAETAGIGTAAREIAGRASSIARLELRLAIAELKEKLSALGLGIGLGLGAAVFALLAVGLAAATVVAALATMLSTWLSLLVVTAAFVAVAGLLAALALRAVRKGMPPVPREAIEEARLTAEAVKGNGRR